jgi:SAM-dependent methyltransferase
VDDRTQRYYSDNAEEYFRETVNSFVPRAAEEFLSHIPPKGRILDCGSGSGRDTKYFLDNGYDTDAIDINPELCRIASEYTNHPVVCMDYNALDRTEAYDGIWAQASLLHERRENLPPLFSILARALRKGGVLYCSFREGEKDGREGERWYTNMTEESIKSLLPTSLSPLNVWYSNDVRPGFSHRWINLLLSKTE